MYYTNCSYCNSNNSYLSVKKNCGKCSGTGKDWRGNHELDDFHAWANISVEELKTKGNIEIEEHGRRIIFTFAENMPPLDKDREEVAKLANKQLKNKHASSIFCDHNWIEDVSGKTEICETCERQRSLDEQERQNVKAPEITDWDRNFTYDKELHDNRYFFPNRCEGCEEYEHTRGHQESGSDSVFCNIGGEVKADSGCDKFDPDVTASCVSVDGEECWNHSYKNLEKTSHYCNVVGDLLTERREKCPYYVCKVRNDTKRPISDNCVVNSRNQKDILKYPEGGTPTRIDILDAMRITNIGMCQVFDHCCRTCRYETNKNRDFGFCEFHDISLLAYLGDNPYGYDDKVCEFYKRKPTLTEILYPEIMVAVSGNDKTTITENLTLVKREVRIPASPNISVDPNTWAKKEDYYKIHEAITGKSSDEFDGYMLRSIQYNEREKCVDINYSNRTGKYYPESNGTIMFDDSEKFEDTWLNSVPEADMFSAIDLVLKKQREHGVYSGSKNAYCEKCKHVGKNFSYPDGSPTGLYCTKRDIFVSANGVCDEYES